MTERLSWWVWPHPHKSIMALPQASRRIPMVHLGIAITGLLVGLFWRPQAAGSVQPANSHPHYEIAFGAENQVCSKIRTVYQRLLDATLLNAQRWPSQGNRVLTNFATTDATSFASAGLTPPPLIEELRPVKFYSIVIGDENNPRTLAIEDLYQGNSPLTAMAVFKTGRPPRLGDGQDAYRDPPVKKDDVDWLISVEDLARSQTVTGEGISYLLKNWPGFATLSSNFKLGDPNSFVPAIGGGAGVTAAAYQSDDESAYVIYDQYLSVRQARELKKTSGDDGIALVQQLTEGGLKDLCYLVVAPGRLAGTLNANNIKQ